MAGEFCREAEVLILVFGNLDIWLKSSIQLQITSAAFCRVRDLQVEATPPCVPPSSLQTRHSDGSSGEPGSRWLLERSRTFLTF